MTLAFGSGCGQMAALLGDLGSEIPKAMVGATDIAMREHLPSDILAFTVNRPMFRQLCELDEGSFLYKRFWERLRRARAERRQGRRGPRGRERRARRRFIMRSALGAGVSARASPRTFAGLRPTAIL